MSVVEHGELRLESDGGTPLIVRWSGKATLRNAPAELDAWTRALVEEAQAHGAVELRFEKLLHANSSSILAMVKLARLLLEKKLPVTICYDARQRWQRFTFEGLSGLDPTGKLLQLKGAEA